VLKQEKIYETNQRCANMSRTRNSNLLVGKNTTGQLLNKNLTEDEKLELEMADLKRRKDQLKANIDGRIWFKMP
jgi:hypothetical protein